MLYSLDELDKPVNLLYELLPRCAIFTFEGTLGAGKTTLVQNLLHRCGIQGVIISPTFTYLASYSNSAGETFYHFDLYRLKTLNDFLQAGFDELLYQPQSWVFIEWPEIVLPIITNKACYIQLNYDEDLGKRRMNYELSPDLIK